jgi:hypothetical protein
MVTRICSTIRNFLREESGSVAVQIGVGMVALLGMVGLGTEGSYLLYKQRQMQSAADSAALSAVLALSQNFPRDPQSEARAVAARLGLIHGADSLTVTVNVPPVSGGQAGNNQAVEVIISQPQDLALMSLAGPQAANVGARSVAVRQDTGQFCILALDPAASQSVDMSNNAAIPNPNCGVAANSTSDNAIYLENNAYINGPVATRGEWYLANNAGLNGSPLIEHGPLMQDPYAEFEIEAPPPCTAQSGSGSNSLTRNLTPGRFCSGWDFNNNVTLNLAPGTYFIDSKMELKNNVFVNGPSGVTLVINTNYAVDLGNNAVLNITAPTSGNYAGVALTSRRDATSTILQKFSNNAVLNMEGAIYFPNQLLEVDNNGTTNPNGCAHFVARQITLMNNVTVANTCTGTGVRPISPPGALVE